MPSERCPRVDPQPGDTLIKDGRTRTVVRREGGDIWYEGASVIRKHCLITTWLEWANKADVVKKGGTNV
jgi:hypothetical protein